MYFVDFIYPVNGRPDYGPKIDTSSPFLLVHYDLDNLPIRFCLVMFIQLPWLSLRTSQANLAKKRGKRRIAVFKSLVFLVPNPASLYVLKTSFKATKGLETFRVHVLTLKKAPISWNNIWGLLFPVQLHQDALHHFQNRN